jgi:subtilase family serine protease
MKLKCRLLTAGAFGSLFLSTSPILMAQTQTLRGHVPEVLSRLQSVGRLSSSTNLHLAIGLPLRNQEALTNSLQQIYDPGSANYHHYLTPEQFAARFGPTEQDYQKVINFAKANGLTVTGTHPNRLLLDVNGAVADIEKALHVTMRVYQHPTEKRTFYAPDVEPSLNLTVPILHISGLDNYSPPRPHFVAKPLVNGQNASPNVGSGPNGTYMGKDFRAAYVPDSSLDGSGQIAGLLEFDGYTAGDIAYYENKAGLPGVTLQNVLLDGFGGAPTGSGGEVEVSLDIEMAISMATNLSEVIVYEAGPYGNWHDILNRMATDNLAKQLSCSWYIPGGGADPVADQIFQQMAAQGQSFFNASGDDDAYTGLISFPGDTPYITQVGGTTLTTSGPGGSRVSETVWNWGNGIGSGGGISTQYPIPSWQTNINMTGNQGSTTERNTPDIALTADNVYVRADGFDYNVGGTSCAAPLWAGFAALVNQQATASGRPTIGFVNPAIDAIGTGPSYTSAFYDITTGNNESSSSPTKFSAASGYDLCTGWGTPNGQSLINALANSEPLLITPATGFTSSGGVGGPFTVTAQSLSLTNAGTNSLNWTLVNTSLWLNASPGSGTLAASGPAATVTISLNSAASNLLVGTYTATVWFTNLNDNAGQSRQFTLSVIAPPTITMQPTNQAVLDGATAVFTVGAGGGLPLFYQWQYNSNNLTDGGNISGSTTTNLVISSVSTNDVGTYTVVVTNIAGVVTSSNVLLTITPSPPVIIMQPANQTAVAGTTVQFTVAALGSKPFFYQWSFNGTNNPIVGATNATLTLSDVQLTNAGIYAVVITNLFGSTLSSNATLTVNLPSTGVPVITAFSPQSGVTGAVVTISGLNFSAVPGNNIVYFGAVQATVATASATNLTVTVPVSATFAPISETVNGLTAYATRPFLPTFFGNGSGISSASFAPSQNLAAGIGPVKVVLADLDGDGKPDLVVANTFGHNVSIYRNISTNGAPLTAASFAPPVTLTTPSGTQSPYYLAVADVDGDGKLDIIATDYGDNLVSVYRNTSTPGSLTFSPRVDFATGTTPIGVEVRDIDGDGKPDLVVANSGAGTISVLRNTGVTGSLTTNSFAPKVDFATGSGCSSVAVGDLDGDGQPDVVTANSGSSTVSLLRNLSSPGSIAFAPAVDFGTLNYPLHVALVDLDGDGKLDVVVAGYFAQAMSVFRNTSTVGSLSLAPRIDFTLGGRGHSTAIGDLEGDGKPDLAAVTEINSLLSVFSNVSTPGSFTNSSLAARVDFATGNNPWGVAVGDLDGDGRPDIVLGNQNDGTLSIYQNQVPFGLPPAITTQPTNVTVVVSNTASFSVAATGSLPLFYQWSFNGTNNPIVGATNATLTLSDVQLTNAGIYAVVITNLFGSTLSSNATLTVYPQYYFAWSNILSPRFVNVPFAVTIQAQDAANEIFTNFTGTVILSSTNGLPVNPPVSASFVQGLWTGFVTISQLATNLVLQAGDGLGQPGLANPINIVNPPTLGTVIDGNSLLIFWPVGSPTFVLETSGDLLLTNWVQVSPPPIPIGGIYLESVPISGTNAFYRLRYSGP